MGEKVSYRHNVMSINSIDTFLNVKGGFNRDLRDVYFIRGLGEPEKYAEKILEIDTRMDREMQMGRLIYIRAQSLPRLSDMEDTVFYTEAFDRWRTGGRLVLKKQELEDRFVKTFENAYRETVEKYRSAKSGVSESMIRNFGIKVLFWLEYLIGGSLQGWNERSCMKVIAENVVKEQEYLFYYCLTMLGCDVLLLENKEDAKIDEDLKQLSGTVRLGDYGTAELEAYVPYDLRMQRTPEKKKATASETGKIQTPEESMAQVPGREGAVSAGQQNRADAGNHRNIAGQEAVKEGQRRANIKVTIPERRTKHDHTNQISAGPQQEGVVHKGRNPGAGSAEKTFEELARLASSIVMIAVHDKNGEVIGTGSGIMIGRDGFILTNDHVAAGGCFYSVRIEEDDQIYPTDEVIKYNSNLDLAVIRIDKKLKPLPVYGGEQKLVRGQKVVAIGSPLGFFNSVSDGIISGFRKIDGVDMIQFTAPTSHGSSGGAVLNMQGEVIGISTAGVDSGQNINLAVGYENILLFTKGFRGE